MAARSQAAPAAPAAADAAAQHRPVVGQNQILGQNTSPAQPSAQAGDVGELFQYAIDTPVTLPRQQSAMLPIVNENGQGREGLDLQPGRAGQAPAQRLRLVNSTDLHLMQGPITVFDGGAYAGDAKIEDLAPQPSG